VTPPAAADLRSLVDTALARGAALLTAGERAVVARLLALSTPAFAAYTNLTGRVERPHRAGGWPPEVLAELRAAGFVDGLVTATEVARASTVPELRAACRILGLPQSGPKDALVAALGGHRGWWTDPWFRVRHRGLVTRLERWALLEAWPDRKGAVLERLGLVRWPAYALTRGAALFPDRRAALRWEAAAVAVDPEAALRAWVAGDGRAPGRLDLERALAERVRAGAEAAERSGDLARAAGWYARWPGRRAEVAFRAARVLEAQGQPGAALRVLREGLADATPSEAVALARAGRRLAKAARTSFPPAPPLRAPAARTLALPRAPGGGLRPRWGGDGAFVEDAVIAHLATHGRGAVHGEGAPWRTLVSLLLADLYFLPIDGALPVPRLPGPLDLGSPAFAARRAGPLAALRARLVDEGAASLAAEAAARWGGIRLAGVDPSVPAEVLTALAAAFPGAVWAALVGLRAAGRSFGGMPDLLVWPGEAVALTDAHPRRLPPEAFAVEVKGPTDALRDHQADWLHTLAGLGVRVELWEIVERGASTPPRPTE
jgi:hypothetical protein